MTQERINPEKVTRPFQLLAAWFVTLIALDAAFLGAARLITEPTWVPGMLSIAAAANVVIFIVSMLLLQTRFRPEMQDDKHYAMYLKERKETAQTADKLAKLLADAGLNIQSLTTAQRKLTDLPHAIESEIRLLLSDLRGHMERPAHGVSINSDIESSSIIALAKGLLAEENWLEAAQMFARYAHYHPDDWEANYARGVAYANSRSGPSSDLASVRAYNEAIAYAPLRNGRVPSARLFAYRGAMLKRLGRLEEAEADLGIATRHADSDYERMDISYNLACVYAMQGRREDMLKQIGRISLNGGYRRAVLQHLHDYFSKYQDDNELLNLIRLR